MDIDELRSVRRTERQKDSLQHLRDSFYEDVAAYIEARKAERRRTAESADDPYGNPEVRRLTDEIGTAEDVVEAIYERRVGKVVKLASFAAADMSADRSGLTAEERALFDDLVERIKQNRRTVLDTLAGEGGDVDPTAGDGTAPTPADSRGESPTDGPPTSDGVEASGTDATSPETAPPSSDSTAGTGGDRTAPPADDPPAPDDVLAAAMGGDEDPVPPEAVGDPTTATDRERDAPVVDGAETDGGAAVTDDAIDEIAFLTRSPVRVRVLRALHRRGPVERREIRELVDGVRTTVTRNLNALTDRGWIEDTAAGYEITDCGRMIVDELVALTESASLAVELRPALRWLDVERLGLDLRHFERAAITTADSTNPYAPVEEQVALVRDATTVRAAFPTVNRQILEACRRTARADGGEVELLLESAAVDRLRSGDRYEELFADVRRHCTVLEYDGTLPYYVGAAPGAVQLGTTDGDNLIRVLLRFDVDDDVRAWADDRFARFERDAHHVEGPE